MRDRNGREGMGNTSFKLRAASGRDGMGGVDRESHQEGGALPETPSIGAEDGLRGPTPHSTEEKNKAQRSN